jgi:hypothetical protein
MKSWSWVLLIVLAILIKWVSLYPEWVEKNYTYGIYPVFSKVQRFLFGWIPFSIGDLFYGFLILVIIFKTVYFFKLLFKKRLNRKNFIAGLQQVIFFFLFIYVFFNLLWGLNYNRIGIANQLDLKVKRYSLTDLDTLATAIQKKLNEYALNVNESARDSFDKKKTLFKESHDVFKQAGKQYPFLKYRVRSIKPSLFSYLGNYLGFQGYYNPFSGEGTVNTTAPRFLEPFVSLHEIAHQVGYAKEDEANFVAFLACRNYQSDIFQYSLYFDLYMYSIREIAKRDSVLAKKINTQSDTQVKKDMRFHYEFYKKYRNSVEPVIMWFYGHYLRANNQPMGKETYNEVVALLVAFYKKYGIGAL